MFPLTLWQLQPPLYRKTWLRITDLDGNLWDFTCLHTFRNIPALFHRNNWIPFFLLSGRRRMKGVKCKRTKRCRNTKREKYSLWVQRMHLQRSLMYQNFFYVFHLFALFIFAHRPYLMFFFFNCCYSYFSAPRSFIDSACFI